MRGREAAFQSLLRLAYRAHSLCTLKTIKTHFKGKKSVSTLPGNNHETSPTTLVPNSVLVGGHSVVLGNSGWSPPPQARAPPASPCGRSACRRVPSEGRARGARALPTGLQPPVLQAHAPQASSPLFSGRRLLKMGKAGRTPCWSSGDPGGTHCGEGVTGESLSVPSAPGGSAG